MSAEQAGEYEVAHESAVGIWIERDVIEVTGPDAPSYLQGQVSQDVLSMPDGSSSWSFILQPHGKVDALVRITRLSERFVIDVDSGFGALVRERLERFKLRVKVDINTVDWKVLAVRGPESNAVEVEGSVATHANWPGIDGLDFLGANIKAPSGLAIATLELYDTLRIESGIPQMGREIDEKTIPAELGLNDLSVSFTKGCYTGQELVARIDSRGNNVPRNLRCVSLTFPSDELPERGAKVMPSDRSIRPTKPYGVLTSVAYSPRINAAVALCLVRRDVAVPVDAEVISEERALSARIDNAPLVGLE